MMTSSRIVSLDDFTRLEICGTGAAGEVWKANTNRDLPFAPAGATVALKVYRAEILREPAQRRRIDEEFGTGSRLSHPHLVKVFHADGESSPPFLVMQWCEGSSLEAWRTRVDPPEDESLLRFCTELLDALEYLHSSRRLHRDVKPKNIHVDLQGRFRLLDLGIVRSLRDPGVTEGDARFIGTYRYSAPEYVFDDQYDFRSDLYSFGATLYYLLYNREVFSGITRTPDLLAAKKRHDIKFDERIRGRGPIWEGCFRLVRDLLAPNPDDRPSSALACMDRLAANVPLMIPLRAYFACALSRSTAEEEKRARNVGEIVRTAGSQGGMSVYLPAERTGPGDTPDLTAPEVYWIDRERVAGSDLLFVYADDPSHGVGQEAEIAGNAGVPIVLLYSQGTRVSRMLRGTAATILGEFEFGDLDRLRTVVEGFVKDNRSRFRLMRKSHERQYHLRVGRRIRARREEYRLDINGLAEKAGVPKEQLEAVESRPEQLSNLSIVNLRRVARALDVTPAELLRDASGKDQQFEDLYRKSLATLREFARNEQLSYARYARLKAFGRDVLKKEFEAAAARGTEGGPPAAITDAQWLRLYKADLNGTNPTDQNAEAVSED
ncbi:serine/threonine protein kinase [bacterium]|nr:serine/threonine protein kinase [bacterium]